MEFLVDNLPNLQGLDLGDSSIGDRGVNYLLDHIKDMKYVAFGGGNLSEDVKKRIREVNPNAKIIV